PRSTVRSAASTPKRQAAAEVRHHLVSMAADRFGVEAADLTVDRGVISNPHGNEQVSYWKLLDGRQLDMEASGEAAPKAASEHTIVGKTAPRIDIRAKVTGEPAFIQDQRFEDMLHGRIVRSQGNAYHPVAIDTREVEAMEGVVKVVVDGRFIGVIAETEYTASRARAKLKQGIEWQVDESLRLPADIHEFLENNVGVSLLIDENGAPCDTPIPDLIDNGDTTVTASNRKPFHMHGSIGPSAATAIMSEDGKLTIQSHSQGPFIIRAAIAQALGMETDDVQVEHVENAGCYGHNGADDAAMDAAMLARHCPGHHILLKWEREDEHLWEPYSPAMLMKMQASLTDGKVTAWNADVFSESHGGRPVPFGSVSNLIAAWHKADPMPKADARPGRGPHGGIHRNADPYYEFPERRVVKRLVPDKKIRTSSTRGLGAYGNVFAIESFMDELANAADADPVEFRKRHLSDPRALAVIDACHARANEYRPDVDAPWKAGRGFAFARYKNSRTYAAVTMFLAVNEETSAIRLLHAIIAADAGQIIDTDGLANQLEGGLIQSASWTLKEAVQFDEFATTSLDW
ncbi:MAG: xanthine dehydrogenase family protein molybdopterin-binding subunit, partial [Pseudomonadales bacterium]|nr:xanthine dehydrogenase family protein molybdopterin-binding subunit [Pseudomonadales bacterium]